MKLRVLSDLHTEGFRYEYQYVGEDVIVLAGDIGVGKRTIDFIKCDLPTHLPIIFVPGNHEFYHNNYTHLNKEFRDAFASTNVHYLNNDTVIIDGVKFIGSPMHSNFGLFGEAERFFVEDTARRGINDFYHIKTGFTERRWTVEDCKEEFEKFERFAKFELLNNPFPGPVVVCTHFCPSGQSVHPRFSNSMVTPFFTSNVEHLMGFSDLWINGHTHDSYDYELNGTRVICNPRGYGSENRDGFNPNLIVEV